jgi:hypothetical protein
MFSAWKRMAALISFFSRMFCARSVSSTSVLILLPDSTLEALNARATALFAALTTSRAQVLYAVTQPYDVNVSEIIVGPRKAFPRHF